jgi:hypothetical protein
LNYGMGADTTVGANGKFITRVRVTRLGELRHAMPVGVHTASGWTIARSRPDLDDSWVDITTTIKPDSIAIDPYHTTWDWDWRDNTQQPRVGTIHAPDVVADWPFLNQANRSRTIVALSPRLWYSGPQGLVGGIGVRTNYAGVTDIHDAVVAVASRRGESGAKAAGVPSMVNIRIQADDVYLSPFMSRPLMGVRGGIAYMDGIGRADLSRRWDVSPFAFANGPKIAVSAGFTVTLPTESPLLPEQWSNARVSEAMGHVTYRAPQAADSQTTVMSLDVGVGYAVARDATASSGGYARALASMENVSYLVPGRTALTIRLNAGVAPNAPLQRSIFASSRDPWETFDNDYVRPRGAAFKQPDFTLIPLGGARLRGFSSLLALDRVVSANVEASQKLVTFTGGFGRLALWAGPFADVGSASASKASPIGLGDHVLADAGVGVAVRGKFYDREIKLGVDVPLMVNRPVTPASLGGLPSSVRWTIEW